MASNREEIVDSPTGAPEAPKDHSDEREPSLASYATIVGIVTGLFGMLLTVGFILLPSATLHEKALVIGASLAVSVAGLTGVGAWRSARKFGLTMLAVGLAVACLVDLSMTAAGRTQATPRTTGPTLGRSAPPSPPPTRTASVPSSVTGSKGSQYNRVSGPVYLSSLTGNLSQGSANPAHGQLTIKGIKYRQSLYYPRLCGSPDSVTYSLDGKSYGRFLAEVGIADGWEHGGDQQNEVTFEVDWKTGSGSFSSFASAAAQAGEDPTRLDVAIPSGTTELQLTTKILGCMNGSTIGWGSARLMP